MYEIEVKILDIDRARTEAALIEMGAEKVFDGILHAFYYDTPDHAIRKKKGTFRLRKEGGKAVLAFKDHVESSQAKIRDETEVAVADFDAMKHILESAGLLVWLEMQKHRTTYTYKGVHFEFDNYSGIHDYIPEFLEIEADDLSRIHKYAGMLGFGEEDFRAWDFLKLAEYYSSSRK